MFKIVMLISSVIFLLQGCINSSAKQQNSVSVTSTPSGAMVYANDKKLGSTPLQQNLYDAFPTGWENSSYQAQGQLIIKKSGCDDFKLKISDYLLSKPIHGELKCDLENNKTQLTETSMPLTEIEKRLDRTETLFKKGSITEEEYNATRKRILNEL
jgi:PEGA domain-containing protein